jgi:hypothetical protein
MKIFIYGHQRFDSTAYQLANFVIIMAKSTIYKTYMASANEEGWTPNYYGLLMMRLKYRLHLDLHRSIVDNDTDRLQNYWLYRQVLGSMEGGRLMVEGLV